MVWLERNHGSHQEKMLKHVQALEEEVTQGRQICLIYLHVGWFNNVRYHFTSRRTLNKEDPELFLRPSFFLACVVFAMVRHWNILKHHVTFHIPYIHEVELFFRPLLGVNSMATFISPVGRRETFIIDEVGMSQKIGTHFFLWFIFIPRVPFRDQFKYHVLWNIHPLYHHWWVHTPKSSRSFLRRVKLFKAVGITKPLTQNM